MRVKTVLYFFSCRWLGFSFLFIRFRTYARWNISVSEHSSAHSSSCCDRLCCKEPAMPESSAMMGGVRVHCQRVNEIIVGSGRSIENWM